MPRKCSALCFLPLILFPNSLLSCACQSSYGSCNEVAASNLVFIGTVESIQPVFLNRWNLASGPALQSLNQAYFDAQDHPSDAALSRLRSAYLKSFPDLTPDRRTRLEKAKTASDITALFYSTLNGGQQIRFKVKTLFKHEEDDDDDVPSPPAAKTAQAKDDDESYFQVSTPFGDCGVQFQAGETYVVYANNDEDSGVISTTACTRTRRLSDAGDDLPYLFFYKNQRNESSRLEGFTTTDEKYQLDLDKMHDPETIKSSVSGVIVQLQSADLIRQSETDGKGRFVFDGLAKGNYTLSAFAPGYPARKNLLAGPRDLFVDEKSCALQILLLTAAEGQ